MNKIVLCLPEGLCNGGVTTWAATLAKRLQDLGLNTEILCHTNPYPSSFAEPSDVKIKHVPGENVWIASSKDILQYLPVYSSSIDGATVLVPNYSWGSYAAATLHAISNRHAVRVLGIAHTDEDHYYELLSHYEPAISKFIGVSAEIVNKLRSIMPHRDVDIYQLACPVQAANSPKIPLNSLSNRIVITYAGRIQDVQKRITDAEALCMHLAQTNGVYHFQFAGDGPERHRLETFFERSNFCNISVDFLGLVPYSEMPALWRGSDVAILFSEFEGTSLAMLEAMGQGTCPLVTNVSGVSDVIQSGVNGYVCEIGDTHKMSQILNELFDSPNTLSAVSAKARLSILARGSLESYDQQFFSIARSCAEAPPASWPQDRAIFPDTNEASFPSLDSYSLHQIASSISKRILKKLARTLNS